MATISEDYVSFKTAKLLKENGFNPLGCGMYYSITTGKRTTELLTSLIACPTIQMAMKWLREVHNIHIVIHPYTEIAGQNWSFIFDKFAYGCWQELGIYITDSCNTYEQACEVAIKYCLENLI